MILRIFLAIALIPAATICFNGCDSKDQRVEEKERVKKVLLGEKVSSPEPKKPTQPAIKKAEPSTVDTGPELDISKLADPTDSPSPASSSSDTKETTNPKTKTDSIPPKKAISSVPRVDQPDQPWIRESQLPRVIWDVQQMGTNSVGYERRITTIDDKSTPGSPTVKNDFLSRTRVSLKGKSQIQTLKLVTTEKLNGELIDFHGSLEIGGEKKSLFGILVRDQGFFKIDVEEKGRTTTTRLEWKDDYRGPFAVEQSMLRKPMKLGENRIVKYLDPVSAKLIESRLVAEAEEMIPLKEKDTRELLRIRNYSRSGDLDRVTVVWADDQGNAFRSYFLPADIVWLRLEEEQARIVESKIDIFFLAREVTIQDDKKILASANRTSTQKFVVKHKYKNIKSLIPATCNQYTIPFLDSILTVMVVPVDSRSTLPSEIAVEHETSPQMLQESKNLELQESGVQEMAKHYVKLDRTPDAIIGNCAKELNKQLEFKPFEGQIQSIRMTRKTAAGNCIEHALFLASVGRAAKVPCRIALGARYNRQPDNPKMNFHAWVEYHDGQRWIPADSTDANFPVSTDRIKLRDSDFNSANPMMEIVEVCRQLSELEIIVQDP